MLLFILFKNHMITESAINVNRFLYLLYLKQKFSNFPFTIILAILKSSKYFFYNAIFFTRLKQFQNLTIYLINLLSNPYLYS